MLVLPLASSCHCSGGRRTNLEYTSSSDGPRWVEVKIVHQNASKIIFHF